MATSNKLSNREQEVVKLLLQGKSNKLIASSLGISGRTVEFHLKNIYAKFQVSSKVELILKLGNTTGKANIEKLVHSTVDNSGKNTENRDMLDSQMNWVTSFRNRFSTIGQELEMKNIFNTKHVPVGVLTALFTGFFWIALLRRFAHMASSEIAPWVLPLIVILIVVGLSIGLIGQRNDNSSRKIFFSTLFGTGVSPLTLLPLMGYVVLPFGKFIAWLGIIDPSTMSADVANRLGAIALLILWMFVSITIGTLLLFVSIRKPHQTDLQTHTPEHSL